MKTYFGYDLIEKQFKVLCVSIEAHKHQVLTLGTGELLWRMVECSTPHFPKCVGICINGVLYYKAQGNCFMIVCFEVRSEKFQVYYQSSFRLGALSDGMFNTRTTGIDLWVLDDAEEQKWSRYIYLLPSLWKNVVAEACLYIVGMTRNGEIVLTSLYMIISTFSITIQRGTIS